MKEVTGMNSSCHVSKSRLTLCAEKNSSTYFMVSHAVMNHQFVLLSPKMGDFVPDHGLPYQFPHSREVFTSTPEHYVSLPILINYFTSVCFTYQYVISLYTYALPTTIIRGSLFIISVRRPLLLSHQCRVVRCSAEPALVVRAS